jgi:hypothetical protein
MIEKGIFSRFHIYKIIIALGLLLSFSCTERIEVGVENAPPMLVVDGTFTSEVKAHQVRLYTTSSYFDIQDPAPVKNALVRITNGVDTFLLHQKPDEPGVYETTPDVCGRDSSTYQLLISNVDINQDGSLEEYSATEFLRPVVKIDSISVLYRKPRSTRDRGNWRIRIFAQEPKEIGNCYLFDIYKNRKSMNDSLFKYRVQYDDIYNGNYLKGMPIGSIRHTEKDSVNKGDTILLRCGSISTSYADFVNETQFVYRGSNPMFGGPAANVWGNIKPIGKALGYFSVYSVYKVDKIYNGEVDTTLMK